jgi:hypothetical protein
MTSLGQRIWLPRTENFFREFVDLIRNAEQCCTHCDSPDFYCRRLDEYERTLSVLTILRITESCTHYSYTDALFGTDEFWIRGIRKREFSSSGNDVNCCTAPPCDSALSSRACEECCKLVTALKIDWTKSWTFGTLPCLSCYVFQYVFTSLVPHSARDFAVPFPHILVVSVYLLVLSVHLLVISVYLLVTSVYLLVVSVYLLVVSVYGIDVFAHNITV